MSVRPNGSSSKKTKSGKNSRKLSARMDSEVVDAFKLFDTDNDGRVTRAEIVDLIESLDGDSNCPHVQELLKASDENGNGSVDISQFMALWISFKAKVGDDGDTEDDIKIAFREYDIDNDGYITKDEMVEAIERMGFVSNKEEEANKCLSEMDLDGDVRVSFAEFMVKWKVT